MGTLPQTLEIVFFKCKGKKNNEKIGKKKKKKAFQVTKYVWTPPIFKSHHFLIFYSF
jgi:hypothetical protein